MKINRQKIIYLICIVFFLASYAPLFLSQGYTNTHLSAYVKVFFLYQNPLEEMFLSYNALIFLIYFSVLFLSVLYLSNQLYQASHSFRSMIMCRYCLKTTFLSTYKKKGFLASLLLVGLIFGLILFNAYFYGSIQVSFTSRFLCQLLMMALNVCIYFNVLVLVILFCYCVYREKISIIIVTLFTYFVMIIDYKWKFISLITYGEERALIIGILAQIIAYLMLNFLLNQKIKKIDL